MNKILFLSFYMRILEPRKSIFIFWQLLHTLFQDSNISRGQIIQLSEPSSLIEPFRYI